MRPVDTPWEARNADLGDAVGAAEEEKMKRHDWIPMVAWDQRCINKCWLGRGM